MIIPCNQAKCINWDSDRNGGHCMLVNPIKVANKKATKIVCKDKIIRLQKKTPR